MKKTFFLVLTVVISLCPNEASAQKQIVCNGEKITIDEKTTFVFDAKSKFAWSFIVNDKAIYLPKPKYPKAALEKKLRGAVNVQVRIDEKGNVISVSAVSGYELLRPSAVEAALKAKFKTLLVDCQPREYTGVIIYNFTGEDENKSAQSSTPQNNEKSFNIGDVTKKAVYLPLPRVPSNVQFPKNSVVRVKVSIDVLSGKVIEAKAVSGLQKLRSFAEDVALCARFSKTNNIQGKVSGYISYKFNNSNKSSIAEMNGGVLNGKAISLPQPILPPDTSFLGAIAVHVSLDEEGNVISAKAVSGKVCLAQTAVEAARKAKFTKTFLSGKPVKVSGTIVYNFPAKQ